MEEIRSGSLADIVFDKLESDILSGKLPEGETLTEIRLSNELNVSRTPVREALRRLEQEKLIRESGKGAVVLGISVGDLKDIYEIRSRIEGLAAYRCATLATDAELAELADIVDLQEFYTMKSNPDSMSSTDTEFHKKIYEMCGSEILSSMLSELHKKVQRYRKLSFESGSRAAAAQKEHRMILGALMNRDPELAERLSVEHILNAEKNILHSLAAADCASDKH